MPRKDSREYSEEFKEAAIRRTTQLGNSVASVARELKIPHWRLRYWIVKSHENLEKTDDMAEIRKLEERISELEEENEILKKAATYFAKSLH